MILGSLSRISLQIARSHSISYRTLASRSAGSVGWHLARASGLRLGEGGSGSVTSLLPSVERRHGYQAGRATPTVARPYQACAAVESMPHISQKQKVPIYAKR